ncbi:Transcription initiation factor TFIID subunit 4 [Nosema granulosis]|uniref:Transcription initiation factor TFIID subunit 4 n=1 Tax=Nosema granulosis TaxID=83296 RepID=A0A9P6KYU6_9MICR|nr:Transcription initiation factor TFIID subunit 4 [Nosema granulosis]
MNRENFERLPMDKKRIIEEAYYSAANKQITPSDFFAICKEALTAEEYDLIFPNEKKATKEQEDIKTEHLQDILQYSGVDLKEEADQIAKETEHNIGYYSYDDEDVNSQMYSLLNPKLFKEYVQKLGKTRGMFISEDSYILLFQILKRKLLDLVEKLDQASKVRVEYELSKYVIKINNDLTRQLWCLEQIEKSELERLMINRDEDDTKKKPKKHIHEREDLVVKKKMSNTIAMAALGIKQRSWMTDEDTQISKDTTQFNSIYAPYDDKMVDKRIATRAISMKDFIYVLERDKRYNKSIFTIQHYFK